VDDGDGVIAVALLGSLGAASRGFHTDRDKVYVGLAGRGATGFLG
jgi:hypothetical protein